LTYVEKIPIKTHVITFGDDIVEVVDRYSKPYRREGDVIIVSSKVVSICQGRTVSFDDIKVGFWANILWRFVTKPQYGIGAIGLPEKMQAAIDLVGLPRILLAAVAAALTRPFGIRGVFYKIAGHAVAEIDGSRILTFEPLIRVVVYGPEEGDKVATAVRDVTGCETAVIDAGDYGNCDVLGKSPGADPKWVEENCRDNPLGQTLEQTPVGLMREMEGEPPPDLDEERKRIRAEAIAELERQKRELEERGEL
jgi:hypothetical protein